MRLLANEKLLDIQNFCFSTFASLLLLLYFCFFFASDHPISAALQHAGVE